MPIYIYIYVYLYILMYVHIYMYTHIPSHDWEFPQIDSAYQFLEAHQYIFQYFNYSFGFYSISG